MKYNSFFNQICPPYNNINSNLNAFIVPNIHNYISNNQHPLINYKLRPFKSKLFTDDKHNVHHHNNKKLSNKQSKTFIKFPKLMNNNNPHKQHQREHSETFCEKKSISLKKKRTTSISFRPKRLIIQNIADKNRNNTNTNNNKLTSSKQKIKYNYYTLNDIQTYLFDHTLITLPLSETHAKSENNIFTYKVSSFILNININKVYIYICIYIVLCK